MTTSATTPVGDPGTARLVLVVGLGRSGTSTAAGALSRLGLVVPQPEVPADESNPRGFHEPQWVVDFHKRLLDAAPARTNDARPSAAEHVRAVYDTPRVRSRLSEWLESEVRGAGPSAQILVKDPRTLWFLPLWEQTAGALGLDVSYLTMLRHPAEVARSRDVHYLADRDEAFRRQRLIGSVSSWVNGTVVTEAATRGARRAFVRYDDLLADWRVALDGARGHLGLSFAPPIGQTPHPVDDFVEPTLNRSRVDWADLALPDDLRALADDAWQASARLVADPADVGASACLADVGSRYAAMHDWAEAMTVDHTQVEVQRARRALRRRLTQAGGHEAPHSAPAPGGGSERAGVRARVRRLAARVARR